MNVGKVAWQPVVIGKLIFPAAKCAAAKGMGAYSSINILEIDNFDDEDLFCI